MTYTFRPAARSQTKPLIGLFGPSGSGKTYSALMLARGFVGPAGRIGMIDTESGRGQLYSDVIPGGYDVLTLGAPFSPQRYLEALMTAEKAGLDALVIDSFSHGWEGVGGVLEMAAEIEQRSGKPGLHCWKEPKLQHQRLVLRLLQTPLFVIVCLRAKYRSRQIKNERTGKNEIIRDENATAIQDEGFLFELTCNAELRPDHTMIVTKTTPGLEHVFRTGATINIDTGRALAKWASGGTPGSRAQPPDARPQETGAEPTSSPAEAPVSTPAVFVPEEVLTVAIVKAREGTKAYREWFKSIATGLQKALVDSGEHEKLKETATYVDQKQGEPL